ncbi:hypothetical protein ACFS4T_23100 [Pseudomonas lini]
MGAGAWEQTPEQRKPSIAAAVANVQGWAHALLNEPTPLQAFRSLNLPVLFHGRQGLAGIVTGSGTAADRRTAER